MTTSSQITFFKARRYRLRPTPAQEERLLNWSSCLVALWNDGARMCRQNTRLWRMGWHKPAMPKRGHLWRIYKATKAEHPDSDFARLPSAIVGALSSRFDEAMDRLYRAGGGRPNFKSMDDAAPALEFPVYVNAGKKRVVAVVFGRECVQFPKPGNRKELGLGRVAYRKHAKLPGVPKTATIVHERGKWYVSVACEIVANRRRIEGDARVGIDLGVAQHATLSDGTAPISFLPAETRTRLTKRAKKLQRSLARAARSSKRRRRIRIAKASLEARQAAVRRSALHRVTTDLANRYGLIAIENLRVSNMTRSAKGDAERPGVNVRAKAGLNRELLAVTPRQFRTLLETKVARTTGRVVAVDPAHTSQRCATCGFVSADNRRTQAEFVCVACGHEENADLNAAKNILLRAIEDVSGSVPVPRKTPSDAHRSAATSKARRKPVIGPGALPKFVEAIEAEIPDDTRASAWPVAEPAYLGSDRNGVVVG